MHQIQYWFGTRISSPERALSRVPVSAEDIRTWTARHPKLSRVLQYIQQGWPGEVEPDLE